ncbi:RING-H2 finger protein ATL40-like [Salvia miltiorrhiza]|uniref:RING-H2 finger protein ATL40-like n=1 Tax=Salvia miltiorrhiza TaxID=226208 RepID=UPI0025ACB77E|nr:RING-H2 finger protein ATL40-like [Salvia miltiorrhiza]
MASQNFEPIHFPDLRDKIDTKKNPLLGSLFLFFVFFITFLFVYFIYVCARRRHDAAASPDSNAPPPGLDPATISSLPVSSYGKKPSHGAECAICLSLFQECDKVKVLPLCRHGFHSDCVDEWLRTRSSCPLCRGCVHRVDSLGREFEPGMWMVP